MIDFRYHLVSIISIFLALAVGIVLGAGPLKEQIGDTLTQEVTQLRKDKSDLRAEVDRAQRTATVHQSFEGAMLPRVVGGQLTDRAVALVVLPGAKSEIVDGTKAAVEAAGGTIASTTTIKPTWIPSSDSDHDKQVQLANDLAGTLGIAAPEPTQSSAADSPGPLAAALAATLVHKDGSTEPIDRERAGLKAISEAGFVDADPEALQPAALAVVVAGPIAGSDVAKRDAAASQYAALAKLIDDTGDGAVLVSDVGQSGAKDASSVVRAARALSAVTEVLSTVDNAGEPMGQASIVLALTQQAAGAQGQYGLESGVTAPYAPLSAP